MKRPASAQRPASFILCACIALIFLHLTVLPGVPDAWAVPGDIAGGPDGGPDGFVGISDLNAVLGNWNQTCDPGGGLFMAFNSVGKFTKEDTFGHFETQNESINNAPKHRAVMGGGGR